MKEVFDFKTVAVTPNKQYLKPGQYVLSVIGAKYEKPSGNKPDGTAKTPFLDVTFGGAAGQISVKFYITPKAFERIQTIYTAWFEKGCDKVFDSTDAIGAFFEKAFNSEVAKKTSRRMIIGGKQANDGKIYAELPYSNYIISDEQEDFKEGAFETNSGQYMYHVKMNPMNISSSTSDVMIPSVPSQVPDMEDDLPF